MKKIPGMSFHDELRAKMAYTPQAIQAVASTTRNPGLDGRLPAWRGPSGIPRRRLGFGLARFGRGALPPFGVVRPPERSRGLRARATAGTLVV